MTRRTPAPRGDDGERKGRPRQRASAGAPAGARSTAGNAGAAAEGEARASSAGGAKGGKGRATRERILAAARQAFASGGYAAVSVRSIASQAGVDQSLVHH